MAQNQSSLIPLITLPKAEVHVHLEGCFSVETIIQLADIHNRPLPRPKEQLFQFSGLGDFLEFLDFVCGLTATSTQLAMAAYAFCQRLQRDGTHYADVIINPSHWRLWRQNIPGLIQGLDAGFCEAEQDGLPSVGLCISLLRQQSAEEAADLLDILASLHHPRVVSLSVDGNECTAGRTGGKFAHAFQRAGKLGLKKTVHAGESSGPEGIRDAIFLLQADRIDHGVRAVEDAELLDILRDQQIPLGVCPTSNVALGLYSSLAEHPIEKLRQHGVLISLNTDDPALLQTSLPEEYQRCVEQFGWNNDIVQHLAATSINASFANECQKLWMHQRLVNWRQARC